MLVYVVMGNDYPDAVFSTRSEAMEYCDEMKAITPKMYWRVIPFKLDETEVRKGE